LETADKADVKTSLAAMKFGGHGAITVPQAAIFSTELVSAKFDAPSALTRE